MLENIDPEKTPTMPAEAVEKIQELLKQTSPWALLKRTGRVGVPNGDPSQNLEVVLSELKKLGVFVVEVGELEGWDRSTGNHGPRWVLEVFRKRPDLHSDPDLKGVREFVKNALGIA